MEDFTLKVPFDGDAVKALDVLATTLSTEGFKILARSAYEAEFNGPPRPRNYGEMSRFWGSSKIRVARTGPALQLNAEMGSYRHYRKILFRILGGILGTLFAMFWALFFRSGRVDDVAIVMIATIALNVVIVFVVVRLTDRASQSRIKQAYATLLNNAAMLGRRV